MEIENSIKKRIVEELESKLKLSSDSDISGIVDEVFRQKGGISQQPALDAIRNMDEGYYWYNDNGEWKPARLIKRNGGVVLHCFSYVSVKECEINDSTQLGPRIFPPLS